MKAVYVKEWMSSPPITIQPKGSLAEAHKLMTRNSIRRLPVMDGTKLVGIVTLTDVLEAEPSDATSLNIFELNYLLDTLTVDRIMTKEVVTVAPDDALQSVASEMLARKIGGLPVMQAGELVGVITESDIFRAFVELIAVPA
jgi:acetoin utilization protein AcuB